MNLQDYCRVGIGILEELERENFFNKDKIEVIENIDHDIKINTDLRLSKFITKKLEEITGLKVLSEEDANFETFGDELHWIVDPLDGSYNYLKGFPFYAISIALVECKKPVLGIVYDIPGRNTYYAAQGFGAFVNNIPLEPPKKAVRSDSILMTGIPSYLKDSDDLSMYWAELKMKQKAFKKVRMIGSATMSIIAVVRGTANHYFENKIAFWDVAAAICIAEELGIECSYDFSSDLINRVTVDNYD